MLCSLTIRDLAVVESVDLEFSGGLSALTGETGAGKSILLTALGLALGDRADSGYIRPAQNRAEVNLEFDLTNAPDARRWLSDNHLDDGRFCIIRRVLSEDGRSKAFINGRPVTLQFLQELSAFLVEIHGQRAHLKLINHSRQRQFLDDYLENHADLERLKEICQAWQTIQSELDGILDKEKDKAAREDLLRFQIRELEQSDIENLDLSALNNEHKMQSNLSHILALGQEQLRRLSDDEEYSLSSLLGRSIEALSQLNELAPGFVEVCQLLDDALIQVQESTQILRRRMESLDTDPNRLLWLEDRLSVVHGLAKKYRTTPEDLPQLLPSFREELRSIEQSSEKIIELSANVQTLKGEYAALADKLSIRRLKGAAQLQNQITKIIKKLGMPNGEFIIQVRKQSNQPPKAWGNDTVEFLVSANPGLPPRSLAKTASGGELSRIGLAIHVAAMSAKTTPTMIFDEVDAGVGGGVAEIVGQQLRSLGEKKQVFCVTHLPQVAAQAHQHLLVKKLSDENRTRTFVTKLSKHERKHEIGRMLGGIDVTEQTLAHAAEMLHWADIDTAE